MLPKENTEQAIVVGAGPAGSFTALELAKRGIKALVYEEHPQIGAPCHCAGHLSLLSLRRLGLYPLPSGIIENVFSKANFHSPHGFTFSVQLNKPVTCALNRELFDRYLAKKAEKAGARFALNSRVESLIVEKGSVRGVNVKKNDVLVSCLSRLVVDAEGISSRLVRQAGLQPLNSSHLLYAVEAEVSDVQDVEEHAVEVYFGNKYAPGFYGWLIPRSNGTAKVGLATSKGNPRNLLHTLMLQHPVASRHLGKAEIRRVSFHAVTLGGPLPKAYSNGFLAVGDAASQVKPTTGGGVIFSLSCAKIVAEVAAQAMAKNDFSPNVLRLYHERLKDLYGFDMFVMLKLRRFLNALSDEQLDNAFRFFTQVGLGEALNDMEEIDFQGRTTRLLLKKPAVYPVAVYLLGLFCLQMLKTPKGKVDAVGGEVNSERV